MRATLVVASSKHTGAAAVAELQVRALIAAGVDARLLFVGGRNLQTRLAGRPWAMPDLVKERGAGDLARNVRCLRRAAQSSDVVISHLSHDHFLCVLAGVHRRATLVRSIRHPRALRRDPLHRSLARPVRAVWVANSDLVPRLAGTFGPVPALIATVPVDDRFVIDGARSGWGGDDGLAIGVVGKLAAGRGFEQVIRALAATGVGELEVVGVGEHRPVLERLAGDLGVADRVRWHGFVDHHLPEAYQRMDLVVVPAPGSDHGHRVVVEAQAGGCVVVASTDLPGVTDLVADGHDGLVFGAGSLEATLVKVRAEANLPRMSEAARERTPARRLAAVGRLLGDFLARL